MCMCMFLYHVCLQQSFELKKKKKKAVCDTIHCDMVYV